MYVNKEGHCISHDGDICVDCAYDGCNCCLFHKAISNYVSNSQNFIDIRIDKCEDYVSNEDDDDDGPVAYWWD